MNSKFDFNIENFNSTYKGTKIFCESEYFALFLKSLENIDLMEKIRFANDVLKVPPVESFIKYYHDVFNHKMERSEKLSLGACFGYLYKYVYKGYQSVSTWVGDEVTGIKNASYFIREKR